MRKAVSPPYQVRTAGFVRASRHWSCMQPVTKQSDISLKIFVKGKGRYQYRDGNVDIHAGDIGFFLPEHEGMMWLDQDEPLEFYYCRFSGDYARYLVYRELKKRGAVIYPLKNHKQVMECVKNMGTLSSTRYANKLPVEMGKYELMLAQALAAIIQPEPAEGKVPVNRESLMAYFGEQLPYTSRLEDACEHFGVSKATFNRKVKEHFDQSPQKVIEEMKIKAAKELLKVDALTITQISHQLGYEDPFYFSKVFKRLIGQSPKEWRTSPAAAV